MTALDEVNFADALLAIHPSTRFVSMDEQSETGQPIFRNRIDECKGAHVTIVDFSVVSQDDFHVRYVKPHPSGKGWIYALVGSGLMSLLRARTADFLPNSLINGELRASIPAGVQRTEKFVEIVLNTAKSLGERWSQLMLKVASAGPGKIGNSLPGQMPRGNMTAQREPISPTDCMHCS